MSKVQTTLRFRLKSTTAFSRPHHTWLLVKRFWPFMRPYKRTLAGITIFRGLGLPISVIPPFLVKYLIDTVVKSENTRQLLVIGLALMGVSLIRLILNYGQKVLNSRFELMVRFRLRRQLFAHLLQLPIRFYTQHDTGYIMSRQRDDLIHLSGIMANTFSRLALDSIRVVIFIGVLFYLDGVLATTGLTLVAAFWGFNLLFSRPLRRRNAVVQEAEAKTATALHEGIIGIRLIKASVREKMELRRYVRTLSEHLRAAFRQDVLEVISRQLIAFGTKIGVYAVLLVGAYRMMMGVTTFGNLFAFFMVLSNLFDATNNLMGINVSLQRGANALQRIYDVLDLPTETAPQSTSSTAARCHIPPPSRYEIVFDKVNFQGFFKTARLGVEDTLTLFSRQTLPIDGKGTVKG